MVDLITGPLTDSLEERQTGIDERAATPGEVGGAVASQAFDNWGFRRLGDFIDDKIDDSTKPLLQPDALKQKYPAIDWTAPTSDEAAQRINGHAVLAKENQDVIDRNQGGIFAGKFGRFVEGQAVGLVDPLNIAAAFFPVAKIGVVGEQLARIGGETLGQRVLNRAATGAVEGLGGAAVLEPFQALQARHNYEDFTMGQALQDLAFGAFGGAVFHQLAPHTIADREAIVKSSVLDAIYDRPADLAPLMDHLEAGRAANALDRWGKAQDRAMDVQRDFPTREVPDAAVHPEAMQLRDRLESLHATAGEVRKELEGLRETKKGPALDPATIDRLADIDHELNGVIPTARRRVLEQERDMVSSGEAPPRSELDLSRDEVQQQGLEAHLNRTEAEIAAHEERLIEIRKTDDEALKANEVAANSNDRSERIAAARAQGQRDIAQRQSEREIRIYAQRTHTELQPGEARSAARDILASTPEERPDVIAHAINSLGKRSLDPDVAAAANAAGTRVADGASRLRTEATGAAQDVLNRQTKPAERPIVTGERQAQQTRAEASLGLGEGTLEEQNTKLQAHVSKVDMAAKAAIQAETVPSHMVAEYEAAQERIKTLKQNGKAAEEAATNANCLARRVV